MMGKRETWNFKCTQIYISTSLGITNPALKCLNFFSSQALLFLYTMYLQKYV